jgi:hypothetical protein
VERFIPINESSKNLLHLELGFFEENFISFGVFCVLVFLSLFSSGEYLEVAANPICTLYNRATTLIQMSFVYVLIHVIPRGVGYLIRSIKMFSYDKIKKRYALIRKKIKRIGNKFFRFLKWLFSM